MELRALFIAGREPRNVVEIKSCVSMHMLRSEAHES